jgi:hypothetical protein
VACPKENVTNARQFLPANEVVAFRLLVTLGSRQATRRPALLPRDRGILDPAFGPIESASDLDRDLKIAS